MYNLWKYIKDYQAQYFHAKMYGCVLLFLGTLIFINYQLDFERSILYSYKDSWHYLLWMFLLQSLPYLVVCGFLYVFRIARTWVHSREFWGTFIFGFTFLSIDRSYLPSFIYEWAAPDSWIFIYKVTSELSGFVKLVFPLMFFMFFTKPPSERSLGLSTKNVNLKPYALILLIAALFVFIGSFNSGLGNYYPVVARAGAASFAMSKDIPLWLTTLVYELVYGFDFLSVELFYRGFLLFAFSRTLGGHAILPMVASYAVLHFGKPPLETISSIFGGYALGIFAFRTGNIWGGVMLHMGVAWLMELFGWWGKT